MLEVSGMRRKNLIMFLLLSIFLLFPFHGYADAQDDVQKGIDAMQRGDFDRSIDLFSNAISSGTLSSEDLASAYFGRGLAWRYKGEDDKAISDFTRAIQMNPNDAAAYNMRAGCYNRKGRFDKALPDFEKEGVGKLK